MLAQSSAESEHNQAEIVQGGKLLKQPVNSNIYQDVSKTQNMSL
jgi:hypothetical protein